MKVGPRSRLTYFLSSWVVVYALIVGLNFIASYHVLNGPKDLLGQSDCVDFTWIWMSSKFATSGLLAQAYDYSTFSAAREAIAGSPTCVIEHLDYPPTLFLFTYSLGLMPYPLAFAVWTASTILIYLKAIYAIIPRWAAVIAALTPYPVLINILLGHNGFLTAGLLGLSLSLMERQPTLAGIFLGLLSYKPQFGILFPIVLLASRNWRGFFSATSATLAFALVAAVVFGYQVWPEFIAALAERAESLSQQQATNWPLVSILGVFQFGGVSAKSAWTLQLIVTVTTALVLWSVWSRPIPYSLKAAGLAIGSVLAAPHAMQYDLCILSIAVAFLVKEALAGGFLPGERVVMLICWMGLFLMGLYPFIVSVVLLGLVIRRANLRQIRITALQKKHLAYG
jgi:hypothetical protein